MNDFKPAHTKQQKPDYEKLSVQALDRIDSQQKMMISALQEVIDWLSGKVTKTEVINQLKSISTPDVDKVVEAVKHLDATVSNQTFDTSKLEQAVQQLDATVSGQKFDTSNLEQALSSLKFDKVSVDNLSELDKGFSAVVKAINSIKFDPTIDVQAPEARVIVKSESFAPLQTAMLEVVQAIKDIEMPEMPESEPINAFISEKFDEYRIEFFGDDDDMPVATHYYFEGKKVASVKYSYNRAGNLIGAKKV